MRDLTKAMLRFGWTLPLFAMKQMASLATPQEWTRPGKVTEALDAVSSAARDQLGEGLQEVYDLGDRVQSSTLDLVFGAMGDSAASPSSAHSDAAHHDAAHQDTAHQDTAHQAAAPQDAAAQAPPEGWGPVPAGS